MNNFRQHALVFLERTDKNTSTCTTNQR